MSKLVLIGVGSAAIAVNNLANSARQNSVKTSAAPGKSVNNLANSARQNSVKTPSAPGMSVNNSSDPHIAIKNRPSSTSTNNSDSESSDTGNSDPGNSDSGNSDPGSSDPGSSDPKNLDPKNSDPGSAGFQPASRPGVSLRYQSQYDTVYGTTREPAKVETLERNNIKPILLDRPLSAENLHHLSQICADAHVLVSFPPSKEDELSIAKAIGNARKIVYISSTGVYGATSGIITEASDVEFDNPSIKPRLESESIWSSHGAVVLRAPALYGPNYGLHISLKSGKFKIPGDGNRYSSRIHLDDLAAIILASLDRADKSSLYVVGDDRPATHREVVTWLCQRLSIDFPESIPIDQAHVTLQANRQINADKIKSELNIVLTYPTFVEGFDHCLSTKL